MSLDNKLKEYIVNINELSKDVFGQECRISHILKAANFSREQIACLQGEGLCELLQNIDGAFRAYLISHTGTCKNCEILYKRYGLFGFEKQTLEQIGQQYGVTRERIRQLQVKTLKLLNKKRFGAIMVVAACQTLKIDSFATLSDKLADCDSGLDSYGGVSGAAGKKKQPFFMNPQMLAAYVPADTPLTISEFVHKLNLLRPKGMRKLRYRKVIGFLLNGEYLEIYTDSDGVARKRPTESGLSMGIFTEQRRNDRGTYSVILYNEGAQQFLIDHMDDISAAHEIAPEVELRGSRWTFEQEEYMTELFQKNVPLSEIAAALKRSPKAINLRLIKLGLIEPDKEVK